MSEKIKTAKDALQTEINGLEALKESLDSAFETAVSVINDMKQSRQGRLIIAGIGKSGHVCRKLAATFASTGTPAYFVHPGEASHGDLGMITEHDVVLMLSNSGENSELSDLIGFTRRFDIHLIAMTSNPQSSLATHADTVLLLPKMPEACPNGMAPTTSTTMMMALGDALAVTLLRDMGLTKEDFGVWHPGGKLGQRLMKVSELMHGYEKLPIVSKDQKMQDAVLELSDKNLGCVLVTAQDHSLLGIITDGDLKRHMSPNLLAKNVTDIMSVNPKSIEPGALGVEAMNIMTRTPAQYLTSLVVMEGNKVLGLIRLQDCLQAGLS